MATTRAKARELTVLCALSVALATAGCDHRKTEPASTAERASTPAPAPDRAPTPAPAANDPWQRAMFAADPIDRGIPAPVAPSKAVGTFKRLEALDSAERVAIARTAAGPQLVIGGPNWVRWLDLEGTLVRSEAGVGGAHALLAFDVDKDGIDEVVIGRGRSREARDAPASVEILYADGNRERIDLPGSERPEIVGIVAGDDGLLVAHFDSKYFVSLLEAKRTPRGAWTSMPITQARVATAFAYANVDGVDGGELIVGRPYGESLEEDGDAFVVRGRGEGAKREAIPTRRGVRGMAASAAGNLAFTDGWHREYGKRARALVSVADRQDGNWHSRVIGHVAGRHGYQRVVLGDLDGDGAEEVVLAGDGPCVIAGGWQQGGPAELSFVAALAELERLSAVDVAVGQLDAQPGLELVIAGPGGGIFHKTSR